MQVQAAPEVKTRVRMRRWLMERIDGLTEFENTEIAQEARTHFLADAEFVRDTVGDLIEALAMEVLRNICNSGRSGNLVSLGDRTVSQTALNTIVATVMSERLKTSRFAKWFEPVDDRGEVSLLAMTASDLEIAIAKREQRVATEGERILFLKEVRSGITEEEQTVNERYSDADLEALQAKVRKIMEDDRAGSLKTIISHATAHPRSTSKRRPITSRELNGAAPRTSTLVEA